MSKKKDDEPCVSCVLAVSSGEYLQVCRKVAGKKQCKTLMDNLVDEKITPAQLFKKVRRRVKKGSKEEKMLDEIDSFMKEEFSRVKSKKTKKR